MNPETGTQRLVFSDEDASFFVLTGAITAAGGRIFAEGIDRKQNAAGSRGVFLGPEAVYELSTDGSGQTRKVFDLGNGEQRVDFHNLFFDSSGSKFGNISFSGGQPYLFVRDSGSGKVLRKAHLAGWRFGSPERIGWMPDDRRIFFTEEFPGGGAEASWTTPGSLVGTYVLNENGTSAERLAPEAELHPKIAGMQPPDDSPAFVIAILPDGRLMLRDYQSGAGGRVAYLFELDLEKKTQELFPLHVEGDPVAFHLSPSGQRLVYATTRRESPKPLQAAAIADVWVLELKSRQQQRLVSFAPRDGVSGAARSQVHVIGWLDAK